VKRRGVGEIWGCDEERRRVSEIGPIRSDWDEEDDIGVEGEGEREESRDGVGPISFGAFVVIEEDEGTSRPIHLSPTILAFAATPVLTPKSNKAAAGTAQTASTGTSTSPRLR
jgi:hypothetical protein